MIGGCFLLDERLRVVAELYEELEQAAFPRRVIVDDEANGVELVGLYSRVSGCIHTWLGKGGRVDDRFRVTLAECEQQLNRAIPALAGHEATYYQRLLDMAVLILDKTGDTQPE